MKIVVLGTSNSVMGNKGFIQALSLTHDVVQLSSGRVPFYYHILTALKNIDVIENADLVLIDHYVNDVNYYARRMGEDYLKGLEEFYLFLSSLNVRILNLFFPIFDISKLPSFWVLEKVKELSGSHSISYLDLNEVGFTENNFANEEHINHSASYALGLILSRELKLDGMGEKPTGGELVSNPYSYFDATSFEGSGVVSNFKNSLLSIDYLDLKTELILDLHESQRLISLGYLKPKLKQGHSGVSINMNDVGLSDHGYFHEVVNFPVFGRLSLCPIVSADAEIRNLIGRGTSSGEFSYTYLVDFLVYDERKQMVVTRAERNVFSINCEGIVQITERLSLVATEKPILSNKTIKVIRDYAIDLESQDMKASLEVHETRWSSDK